MVRMAGIEPAPLSRQVPKTCVAPFTPHAHREIINRPFRRAAYHRQCSDTWSVRHPCKDYEPGDLDRDVGPEIRGHRNK